ncbi:MAG: hypothetical protein IV105_19720 [Rhizobacter sp.]|nr:hypothetical protein [Rhizobacter sp.]
MTDEERDAHLRAALRHAPDAQLQPPPALSDLILKEARAKARDALPPAPAPRHPLWRAWDWLARPSVATAFAGVMVATLIGLMWWDQPMDEAMPRPPIPAAAPAPVAPPPPAAPIAEVARPAPAAEPTQAPQRKPAPAAKPAPPAAPARELAAREEAAAPVVGGAAQPAREAAPTVALAAPPPAPAPAPAADTATTGAAAMSRAQSFDESKRQRNVASADSLGRAARTEARATELRHSVAQVRAAIAAEPARWMWQRDGGPQQAMNDVVSNWLARLDADAGDRWQPVDASTLRPGREIRLLRDGHTAHGFRLVENGVLWRPPQGRWQHVTLPPTSLSALETGAP